MYDELEVVLYDSSKTGFRNALRYDAQRYEGPANQYREAVTSNAYMKLIGLLDSKRVLDVGCGTGRGLVHFASSANLTIGADASPEMLVIAQTKLGKNDRVALTQCYAQCLPFRDESFDIVTCLNFLHLFSLDTQRVMVSEMRRVVKRDGIIVLEFDNALSGFLVGSVNRWLGRVHGAYPSEISTVIGNETTVLRIYGALYPVVWRLFFRFPKVFIPLEKLACYWPLNRLGFRIFYKLSVR